MVTYPSDWKITSIEKLGKCYSGLSGKSADDFGTGSSNYITFLNVLKNIKVDIDALEKVSILSGENQNAVKKGDLFFNISSETPDEVGMCAALLTDLNNVYLNSFCFGYRLYDTSVLSPLFASYFFNSIYGRQLMSLYAQGSTRYNLSKSSFIKMEIPVPSIKEQQAITSVLSDFDEHIDNLTKLIEKKKAIRDGALEDLVSGRTRLDGFNGEWVEMTLEDICVPNGLVRGPFGGSLKKEMFVSKGNKVYEQRNAIYKSVRIGDYYISNGKYNELSRFAVKADDFIVSCSGTIGKIFKIPKQYKRGIINQALLKISIDQTKCNLNYFYKYFEWDKFQDSIIDNTQGGAMKNLVGMDIFRKTVILMPRDITEQKAIAQIISAMDEEIESLKIEKEKMIQIKEGAMDDLLTGRVRLNV